MLSKFEKALQSYDPLVTIPYWEFTEASIPSQFATWKPQIVFYDPFNGSTISHQVSRNPYLSEYPTAQQVRSIYQNSATFNQFWNEWEASASVPTHDVLHSKIGSTMQQPWKAVADPIFWVFHAEIDHVWALWQQQHPTVYPTISGSMAPWIETAADVRYTDSQLNYVYE